MDGLSGRFGVLLPAAPRPILLVADSTSSVSSVRPNPPAPAGRAESGTAGTPFLVAIPLGLSPEVIISLWTLLGGGGVLGNPFPKDEGMRVGRDDVGVEPDPDAEPDVELTLSSAPHGKYPLDIDTGVCRGEPLTGVLGAIRPSGWRRLPPTCGRRLTMGFSIDLTNEVEERDAYRFLCITASRAGDDSDRSIDWFPIDGDGGADASVFVSSHVRIQGDQRWEEDSRNDGRALSLALRLKNKNSGTNQTQIPKKAAISIKVSSPAP